MEKPYLVLARKYRPTNFHELIGQEALVTTLTNAIKQNRIAHAFILTGIRGVGKTTSARIIAKALNCIGPDGNSGPTAEPCGICSQCTSIAEDRNVDVIETDAASKTGVGDIREIIDNARYMPVAARYKIYIIDEVHMLSKSAFNALLKTLEEPPPHVKFIFATTEIRKIPLTILSRCQRFDLARVPVDKLVKRFSEISAKEGFEVEEEALLLIAKMAEGSVRDGLSLLDQALSRSSGKISAQSIRDVIGLSDHARIFDLFEVIHSGKAVESLNLFRDMYNHGSDPAIVLEDLLELVHYITVAKHNAENSSSPIGESDPKRAKELAAKISVPSLVRSWQILMKGIGEAKLSANSLNSAEMVLIKLCYTSNMPTPDELIKNYRPGQNQASAPGLDAKAGAPENAMAISPKEQYQNMAVIPKITLKSSEPKKLEITNFKQMVDIFQEKHEHTLHGWLVTGVHLVSFEPRRIEFRPSDAAPANLAGSITKCLNEWTDERWVVVVSNNKGSSTVAEEIKIAGDQLKRQAAQHPNVKKVLDAFPGAAVVGAHKKQKSMETPPWEEPAANFDDKNLKVGEN